MSSAHRPTWAPAQGKEGLQNSKVYSSRDIAAHTRLKFRQPGQGGKNEVARRDLKLELMQAERDSNLRKKKGERGLVVDQGLLLLENQERETRENEEATKRRRLLDEVKDLDKDDEEEDESASEGEGEGEGEGEKKDLKGKGKAIDEDKDEESEEEDSDDDDDEDETAELLRELEKIKKERAEEKERQERERAATEQTSREEEIATGNPLLNLQAALGASPSTMSTVSRSENGSSSFGVKRRWDDDVIFKNQARGVSETPKKEFVNDLLRTEFHKKFLSKFIQ
ncbi:hypothetical protein JCM5353_002144 [Sporobolomyces roseus]